MIVFSACVEMTGQTGRQQVDCSRAEVDRHQLLVEMSVVSQMQTLHILQQSAVN